MGVLQGLRGKTEQDDGTGGPVAPSFPELDLDKLARELNLAEEGKKRGEKNLPPASGNALDDIEHKIIATIEAEQKRQAQSFNRHLNICHQRIAGLDLENEAVNIGGTAQRASTDFVVKVDEGKAKLFTLWRNVCMIEKQWNDFRTQNKLTHPADYPLSRLWNFAVILAILATESFLNGSFLARGLETGLIGGIIQAFVIAAINVFFGLFLGFHVMRYSFHRSAMIRLLALIEIPISIGMDIVFNLVIGHYRDALGGPDPEHASNTALNSFTMHPFELGSIQSWILFALGIFFFAVATVDGFKMDDPYPGYGKISRKHEEITQDYSNEKANIIDDLGRTRDHALDAIREARQNLTARRSELAQLLGQQEQLIHVFESHRAYLERAANNLLSVYRNANIRARKGAPPPHFSGSYTLPQSSATRSSDARETMVEASIEKTDAELRNAIKMVNTRFEEAVGAFHQIGELADGKDHAAPSTPA